MRKVKMHCGKVQESNENPKKLTPTMNSIILHVSVPVLSEKTWSTIPSSSFKSKLLTSAGVSVSASYILESEFINMDCMNLTTSNDTYSEIGTKFPNIMMNVKKR